MILVITVSHYWTWDISAGLASHSPWRDSFLIFLATPWASSPWFVALVVVLVSLVISSYEQSAAKPDLTWKLQLANMTEGMAGNMTAANMSGSQGMPQADRSPQICRNKSCKDS